MKIEENKEILQKLSDISLSCHNRSDKYYNKKYNIPKEDLIILFIKYNLTIQELADFYKVYYHTIMYLLKKFNIKKSKELIEKSKERTCVERFGRNNYFSGKEGALLVSKAIENKYGVKNISQSKEIKLRKEETCLKNYGVRNPRNTKEYLEKYKDINFVENINEKRYLTRKKNGTMITSKIEDKIYKILLTKFPDTIHHYKSKLYPFICDFYIPKLNLYIEYNGHWKHGKEPFDKHNIKHIKIIEKWKNKAQEIGINNKLKYSYNDAINNWTQKDVFKRNTAKKNNLNFLEFWSEKSFLEWFMNLD